jgi:hypothetical protein
MRSYLDRFLALIKSWVPHVPAELFCNLDETDSYDWEERKPKPVFIPTTVENADLHRPVDRGIRHQTLLCRVSATGNANYPLPLCSNTAPCQYFI